MEQPKTLLAQTHTEGYSCPLCECPACARVREAHPETRYLMPPECRAQGCANCETGVPLFEALGDSKLEVSHFLFGRLRGLHSVKIEGCFMGHFIVTTKMTKEWLLAKAFHYKEAEDKTVFQLVMHGGKQ